MRFTIQPDGGKPFCLSIPNRMIFSRMVFWLLPHKWRDCLPDGFDYEAYARFSSAVHDAKQRFPNLALFDAIESDGSRFRIDL